MEGGRTGVLAILTERQGYEVKHTFIQVVQFETNLGLVVTIASIFCCYEILMPNREDACWLS